MTEQEIQELQAKVLELSETNQTLAQERDTLKQEKETLETTNATLSQDLNTYKDMNAKLSLNIATSITGANNPFDTGKQEEKIKDEPVKSLDDILKEID